MIFSGKYLCSRGSESRHVLWVRIIKNIIYDIYIFEGPGRGPGQVACAKVRKFVFATVAELGGVGGLLVA